MVSPNTVQKCCFRTLISSAFPEVVQKFEFSKHDFGSIFTSVLQQDRIMMVTYKEKKFIGANPIDCVVMTEVNL